MRAKSSASLTLAAGLPLASNLNNLIPLLTTLRTSSDEVCCAPAGSEGPD